ncbi:MAG: hypothetical protein E2O97_00520, partial [Acidobacteria bacterium]
MIQQDQNRVPKCGGGRGRLLLWLAALILLAAPASAQVPAGCPNSLHDTHGDDLIRHDMSASFCTLCAQGFVTIVVENPTRKADAVDFTGIIINEDLGSSGLTYVGPTTVSTVNTATTPSIDNFSIGGGSNQLLSWEMEADWTLGHQSGGGRSREQLILRFGVERTAPFDLEGLVDADRDLLAEVDVIPSCNLGDRYQNDSGDEELPIREPVPDISKGGRNVDAAQGGYSGNVFGHVNDDVIWRVRIRNDGDAPLQDVLFDDVMDSGNFVFDWVCDSEGDALNAARNTGSTGDCQNVGGVTDLSNENPRLRFDPGADPYIVANGGATRDYFLVGRVTNSCEDRSNTVSGAEWGCQDDGSPAGGIVATSTFNGSAGAGRDTDPLLTLTNDSNVNVGVVYSGVDTNDAMGSTGLVTITIRNLSNGTIKGEAGGMQLEHVLPPQYVIDPTFVPTVSMNPLYGNYVGMIDTIQWTNPVPGTDDQSSSDPDDYLANTDLDFLLTSTGPNLDNPDQLHMIRHGDVLTITFRTVLIDPNYYDLTANLDVRVEDAASTPAGTDPAQTIDMMSQTRLRFEELCNGTLYTPSQNDSHTANPEDLDVDMDGSELLFILTGQGDSLRLTVNVSNEGGHVADDYVAYITFGEAMRVQSADPDCTLLLSPPVLPNWELPADLPTSAAIYRCDGRGAIPRFSTETFIFDVIKNPDLVPFDDDLTFRADVIGEVRLSDGTLLWFPPPQPRVDLVTQGSVPDTDRANNYSLDGVRARVVGYDLLKSQDGICTENNDPLPGDPDDQVQIGEECSYYVQSGGWFGFQTPGFSYIAVQDIQVVDQIPDGQGYITSTPDPLTTSTSAIKGVSFNPPPAPLDEGFFNWTFNTDPLTERITVKDHWFRVYVTTRLLNDPIDTVAPPNQHADLSTNILTSTFQAVFYNDLIKDEEVFDLGPLTIGYPAESYRQVDLTVTEPNLILTKEVCNETLYGPGESCGNFVPLADDGDAYDTYVYRIGITNEETSGKVLRAPAYDVTVTSVTDPSDQLEVELLGSDGVDNDADMDVDGADGDGEGTITDNVLLNGVPAQVIASYTHSADLLKIEPNETVYLYYRVDP